MYIVLFRFSQVTNEILHVIQEARELPVNTIVQSEQQEATTKQAGKTEEREAKGTKGRVVVVANGQEALPSATFSEIFHRSSIIARKRKNLGDFFGRTNDISAAAMSEVIDYLCGPNLRDKKQKCQTWNLEYIDSCRGLLFPPVFVCLSGILCPKVKNALF